MVFIKFLEGIRTPFFDSLFSIVTRLGEEAALLFVVFLFLWCINKKCGYYICALGVAAISSNLFLKMIFRVPRPWVLDPSFEIVESAREAATGYSFPSGHTQISVALYGGIARAYRNKVVRFLCILAAGVVAFSRMYLGVHTLQDVVVGALVSAALIFVMYFAVGGENDSVNQMNLTYGVLAVFCITYLAFLYLYPFPAEVDTAEVRESIENGYKMLGIIPAMWLSFIIDARYTHYKTSCIWWGQAVKLVLGFAITFTLKEVLKAPLSYLFCGHAVAGMFRYFAIAVFAGCVWPLTFKFYPENKNRKSLENA